MHKTMEEKPLTILREHYLSKGELKVISLYTELKSLRRLKSESIIDYMIRTENISNVLKEARELISDSLNCHGSKRITSEF